MTAAQKKALLARSTTVPAAYDQVHEVEFWEDIYEAPAPGEFRGRLVGKRLMRGRVHVMIDVSALVKHLGRIAIRNKTKKSSIGPVRVASINEPYEVRKQVLPGSN